MKAVLSYIWILLVFIGVMIIANLEYGLTMLQVFIFGAIFSFMWKYFTRNSIVVDISFSHAEIDKGGKVTATIKIANQSILPTSFIDIYLICPQQCEIGESPVIRVSLAASQTQEISCEYLGKIRGAAKIGIQKVVLKSYFGWFNTVVVDEEKAKKLQAEVIIMPKIFHVDISNELFMTQVSDEEESEDEENSKVSLLGGQPGYEFRNYRPGDALSRINWKLSAKRETLIVRESVVYLSNNKLLCINPYAKETLTIQERLLESILSVAYAFITNDIPVQIMYYENGEWILVKIENMTQFNELKVKLARYEFKTEDHYSINKLNLNLDDLVKVSFNIFLFSSTIDDYCYTMLRQAVKGNINIHQVLTDEAEYLALNNSVENSVWMINSQNEILNISK